MCWIVLFDPGTGLEAELAELYVRPEGRGQGIANRLVAEAMNVLRSREVTFACVWTRGDNDAALAAYRGRRFRTHRADRPHLASARLSREVGIIAAP